MSFEHNFIFLAKVRWACHYGPFCKLLSKNDDYATTTQYVTFIFISKRHKKSQVTKMCGHFFISNEYIIIPKKKFGQKFATVDWPGRARMKY
jgi:hypothetical protein